MISRGIAKAGKTVAIVNCGQSTASDATVTMKTTAQTSRKTTSSPFGAGMVGIP